MSFCSNARARHLCDRLQPRRWSWLLSCLTTLRRAPHVACIFSVASQADLLGNARPVMPSIGRRARPLCAGRVSRGGQPERQLRRAQAPLAALKCGHDLNEGNVGRPNSRENSRLLLPLLLF